ncbi:MAG: type II toxin-antitoxin system RelE/ParE family toxin [Deltaproteobacteria bacterium]
MVKIKQTEAYEEWFNSLSDGRAKARIDVRIRRMSLGNPGETRPVGEGVMELKIDYGPGYRVYYLSKGKTVVILLAGGDKKTQNKDIARAKMLAKEIQEEG